MAAAMNKPAKLAPADAARRLASLLTRLGPTFVKIGQYLALRPDILPQAYCDELLTLVDRSEPFAWSEAERIVEAELGAPVSELFDSIERRPIGAGSLAQVHRAHLHDGAVVAIKILRPGIERRVARDIRRMRLVGQLVKRLGITLPISVAELADELAEWLRQEIDFERELDNARKLQPLAAGSTLQRIPRTYLHLSSSRVITYEYLEGIRVNNILAELRGVRPERASGPLLTVEERREFAERLVTATLIQIFRYRFFHADLHPGNLLVLPDRRVGFVDFGLCDKLDETVRANQLSYVSAIYAGNQPRIFKALTEVLVARPESDVEGLRRDFDAEMRAGTQEHGGASSTANALIGVLRVARRNGYQIPSDVLSLYRALVTVETLATELGLPNGLRDVGGRFFAELRRDEKFDQLFDRDRLQQVLLNTLTLTQDGPAQLAQILADAADGSVRLRVESTDAARVVRSQNRRARLWTAAILAVSVAVLLTIPNLPLVFGVPLEWPLGVALGGLYLACAVLWRRL
jgi:ubiquinone biosynthesis protein